ncbi:sorting nexin-2 [Grus japonensis]|uniref:Sorting nexin-2 n=1 Tax=Grus japonensis TaxID=30415 RepID=A0ABC9YB37_GRUJA
MVEATTGWLETYPVPHATARNTILGLEKQVLWRHGTPERIESDNGTHFRNNLIDTWAKEHGIEWVYHIPYHAPASGKIERDNGLLKTALRAMGGGTLKHWDTHLAKATWLVNTRGSANRAGPAQSKLPHTVKGDKVPIVHMKNMLGKTVWVIPASGKGKPICGIAFAQGPGCTWWVMRKDGQVRCAPQGDLILEAIEEVSLDSPERDPGLSPEPTPAITPVTPTTLVAARMESKSVTAPVIFDRSREEIEEEANGDLFDIEINISDPEKVGDGMNAYMAYRVTTKTSLSMFHKNEFSVKRRFSDFLGLHSKLVTKYMHIGYIVPPAPEKSIVGMTKVKVGKEDSSSVEFIEKRRAALERYLQRTVKHPTLLQDPDLRQFLESSELPRAVNTQALSGAGILRMVNKAADAVNKMTIKMNESDAWFEEKQQQFENLDQQLRKLHASVEALVCHRKELSANTAAFAKSAAMLGNSEDHTALSRALSQLAEVEEKIDQLHQEQAFADFYVFSELLGDYIRLIAAVKVSTARKNG